MGVLLGGILLEICRDNQLFILFL